MFFPLILLYFSSLSFGSLIKNCNHKGLGIYYLLSAFIFGISGTLISVLIRIELYSSGNRIITPENQNFYNISNRLSLRFPLFSLLFIHHKERNSKRSLGNFHKSVLLQFCITCISLISLYPLKVMSEGNSYPEMTKGKNGNCFSKVTPERSSLLNSFSFMVIINRILFISNYFMLSFI